MHAYLNQHPQIYMSREKELNFFVEERNWHKGVDWYAAFFKQKDARFRGESSPSYSTFPLYQGVPERMYRLLPEAKLIYMLRDPLDRIVSHYVHRLANGTENRPLSEAVTDPQDNIYIYRSRYYSQLQRYLEYYPEDSILLITLEDLSLEPTRTLQACFSFLGLEMGPIGNRLIHVLHSSKRKRRKTPLGYALARTSLMQKTEILPYAIRSNVERLLFYPFSHSVKKPVLSPALKDRLVGRLQGDIDQLRKLTGLKFQLWSL